MEGYKVEKREKQGGEVKSNRRGQAMVAHAFNPSIPGGTGRQISVSSRPAWSTRASSRTGSKVTEKPCLEKQTNKNPP